MRILKKIVIFFINLFAYILVFVVGGTVLVAVGIFMPLFFLIQSIREEDFIEALSETFMWD